METLDMQLGCFVYDGNSSEMMMKNKYLGNIYEKAVDDRIKVTFRINADDKMDAFTMWWLQHLNHGVNPFIVEIPYFGKVRKLVVKMTNNLKTSLDVETGNWLIPMELGVQYLMEA